MIKRIFRQFVGLILGLSAASSWAGPISFYNETISFDGAVIGTASAPHSTPLTYLQSITQPTGQHSVQSVTTASTPAPYVLTETLAYNPGGSSFVAASGSLSYNVNIFGPAFTWVPVVFEGQYSFMGYDLAGVTNSLASSGTRVNFAFGGTVFDYSCSSHSCLKSLFADDHASILVNETKISFDAFGGNFHGIQNILTDASGYATTTVNISAGARSIVSGAAFDSFAVAFIDPEFHIDPTWLALNPGASLSLPEGVGNAITSVSVPEPHTLGLIGLGLAGLGYARRRKV